MRGPLTPGGKSKSRGVFDPDFNPFKLILPLFILLMGISVGIILSQEIKKTVVTNALDAQQKEVDDPKYAYCVDTAARSIVGFDIEHPLSIAIGTNIYLDCLKSFNLTP